MLCLSGFELYSRWVVPLTITLTWVEICIISGPYLSYTLVELWHHGSKNPSVFILYVGKFLDIIWRCLKWLDRVCAMNCLEWKVQKQRLRRIMRLNNIHGFFCKQLCTVLAPLCPHRLKNEETEKKMFRVKRRIDHTVTTTLHLVLKSGYKTCNKVITVNTVIFAFIIIIINIILIINNIIFIIIKKLKEDEIIQMKTSLTPFLHSKFLC